MLLAEHTVIRFTCPSCGHAGRAAHAMAGRVFHCPCCTGRVTIPPVPADPPPTVLMATLAKTAVIGYPTTRRPA